MKRTRILLLTVTAIALFLMAAPLASADPTAASASYDPGISPAAFGGAFEGKALLQLTFDTDALSTTGGSEDCSSYVASTSGLDLSQANFWCFDTSNLSGHTLNTNMEIQALFVNGNESPLWNMYAIYTANGLSAGVQQDITIASGIASISTNQTFSNVSVAEDVPTSDTVDEYTNTGHQAGVSTMRLNLTEGLTGGTTGNCVGSVLEGSPGIYCYSLAGSSVTNLNGGITIDLLYRDQEFNNQLSILFSDESALADGDHTITISADIINNQNTDQEWSYNYSAPAVPEMGTWAIILSLGALFYLAYHSSGSIKPNLTPAV